jgi:hypothetical protein
MILYHYTGVEYLDAIMDTGLSVGDVPTSKYGGKNGVWLTTDHDPAGHGLSDAERSNNYRFANKRAVRITVKINSSDRRLVEWLKWGRKHCEEWLFDALNETGGGKHATWFVYFGVIEPDRFSNIEFLTAQLPELVFAGFPDGSKSLVRGSGILKAIVVIGREILTVNKVVPVTSEEEAAALEVAMHRPATNPFIEDKLARAAS